MGKGKQKFNKKQAVRFTLVPGFDENGKPITHFRPVETKRSRVSANQRQKIIRQISDETYDEIQINGRMVGEGQIPAFVLEQIRGRKDLVFNEKLQSQKMGMKSKQTIPEGDLYQVMDADDYNDQNDHQVQQVWIDEEQIIDQQQYSDYDDEDDEGQWSNQQGDEELMEEEEIYEEQTNKEIKQFKFNEKDFPVLNKVNIQGKEYELTEEQIKLLDVLIPQNYEQFKIKGLNFEKYDQNGLPLSQKYKYEEFLATGNQGIVDVFQYVPDKPTPIYDTDLKPSEIKGDVKEVEDALNFDGEEGVYEELEDDFFAKMIQAEIQTNKKEKKSKNQKPKKTVSKTVKPISEEIFNVKLPKVLEQPKEQKNIFSKYDELDEDILEEEITDEMIQKALDDFEHNLEPKQGIKIGKNKVEVHEDGQDMHEGHSGNNLSMNFSEIEKCEEFFGKDGELDWRCLTKKEKKEYMKTKIIRSFYDEVREREIEQKMKGKKNITEEELHLKTMVEKLTFEEDHVMRRALEQDAKEVVDLDADSSYESQSEEEDIIEYHQRTSVISSNLNEISEPTKKRVKKKQDDDERLRQLDELSQTLSKLRSANEKRDRKETKQERKARKEKQKQLKKQKKQVKKLFSEKFQEQRRKHIKMTKPSDPLHKVSFVKII